jgi:hypothetical protein
VPNKNRKWSEYGSRPLEAAAVVVHKWVAAMPETSPAATETKRLLLTMLPARSAAMIFVV